MSFYRLIEKCSPKPRLELFARHPQAGWAQWGDEIHMNAYAPKKRTLPYQVDAAFKNGNRHVVAVRGV